MSILSQALEERAYQKAIVDSAEKANTLVVLPTGMGKTLIAVILAARRIEKFPGSKILILSPTRPLSAQHKKTIEEFTKIDPNKIFLVTGKIPKKKRAKIYQEAKIISATPQTIENDLNENILSLEDFSLAVFDEAHRGVKEYAYPYIAKKYMLQAKNPLILALTASPGSTYNRIDEVMKNLFIRNVEVRTEYDSDVLAYIQPVRKEWIYVDFGQEFQKIRDLLQESLKENLSWLRKHKYIYSQPSKKDLLELQNQLISRYQKTKNGSLFGGMIKVAEAVKLEHAIELLETQGISPTLDYFEKLKKSKKQTDRNLVKKENVNEAIKLLSQNYGKKEHPKLNTLLNLIKEIVSEKNKIIVFANYRYTVEKIVKLLAENGISTEHLVGQAKKEGKGLSQKEQIKILKRFANEEFQVLVTTSIGEEGIDIPKVDYVIFYEPVPSEIRTIQRRGRVGRMVPGKAIFLITKGTRDEAYYWAAFRKERRMKGILLDLKARKGLEKKRTLIDWIKG